MSSKFRIFSTDISPTVDPDSAEPLPSTLIVFTEDPDNANYNPSSGNADRGSVFSTLGGTVFQDFGVQESDDSISFSATDSLSSAVVNALESAYETIDEEWYFTDGYNCWKVRFSRNPKGFKYMRNIFYAYKGRTYFSYEIRLLIVSKEI